MYSMTPNFFGYFIGYEYQKYAEFYADFKFVKIITNKCTSKKLFAKNICNLVVWKRKNSNFAPFFACNFFISEFFAFFSRF